MKIITPFNPNLKTIKKSIYLLLMCFLNSALLFSQVAINTDGSAPDPSAILDLTSANKGLLLPRMTHAQLNTITNPAEGLIVFCTDCASNGLGTVAIFVADSWSILNANCLNPLAPETGTHVPSKTQIAWNWNAVTGATGYKWNSTDDYENAEDMGNNTTKTETNLLCETEYTRFVWAYNVCGNSTPVALSQSTSACWVCGNPITINHMAGNVAPVTKTVTYGTVNNIPGETSKCWITSNLGADHQATAKNDATEASAGWYWQFNLMQGYKHDGSTRTPNTTWITSINQNSDWTASNDPCVLLLGSGWRLPTSTEWTNVDASGGWTDWNGPWNSFLKMHAAGDLNYSNGSLSDRGSYGVYWSSSQYVSSSGWDLVFNSGSCIMSGNSKSFAFSSRCLRE